MWGFVFFAGLYLVGDFVSTRFALPIPGSIIGLGMALAIFALRGKVDTQIKPAGDLLIRYLPVLLVPIGVGVIRILDAPPAGLWRLEVVLVLALVVGVLGAAKITQGFLALGRNSTPAPASPSEAATETAERSQP
jgi:holin-like protein